MTTCLASLALMLVFLWSGAAFGEVDPSEEGPSRGEAHQVVVSAQAAFGGYHRSDGFATTHIIVENKGPDRRFEIAVVASTTERVIEVDMARGAVKRLQLTMPVPRYGGWRVEVREAKGRDVLARATPPVSLLYDSAELIAFVGKRPPGLKRPLLKEEDGEVEMDWEGNKVARTVPSELPEVWMGYQPVSALVWLHPRFDVLSPVQVEALEEWVVQGGHLVVAVDERWREVAQSRLARILPVVPEGVEVLEGTEAIGDMLGAGSSFGGVEVSDLVEPPERLPVLKMRVRAGAFPGPESFDHDSPLTLTWSVGDGQVTVWRTGPERTGRTPTFEHWEQWLLEKGRPIDRGYVWEAVRVDEPKLDVNILALLFVLIVYIAIIGPVDFVVLKRMRRLEWTALTYPVAILIFSGLAWFAMSTSIDSTSFETRLTLMHWHLPQSAVSGLTERERPVAGRLGVGVYSGFFPTSRQRLQVSPPGERDRVWIGSRHHGAFATVQQTLRGVPAKLEVVAPAYAMLPIEISMVRHDERVPVKIKVDEDDEKGLEITVENKLAAALRGCWLRVDELSSLEAFDVEPGGRVSVTSLGPSISMGDRVEGYSPEEQIWRNLGEAFGERWSRDSGALVCHVDDEKVLDLGVEGRGAEEKVRRGVVRFVF